MHVHLGGFHADDDGWRICFGESTNVPQKDPAGVIRTDGFDPRLVELRGAMILEGQMRQLVESLELVIALDNR